MAARRNECDEQTFGRGKRCTKRRRAVFLLALGARLELNVRNVNELDERAALIIG